MPILEELKQSEDYLAHANVFNNLGYALYRQGFLDNVNYTCESLL